VSRVIVTLRCRVPHVSRRRRASRRSSDNDAARSPGKHRTAGAPAGPGATETAMPRTSLRGDWPGRDADQAVTALYHAHCRSLARIAALLAGDSAKAEEILRDAFVAMHRAWWRLQDGDKALGYLRRAVVTGARSRSAAPPDQHTRPRGLFGAGQPAPDIPGAPLVAVLSGLPARQREALVLKVLRGLARAPDRRRDGGQQACAERPYPARHVRPPDLPGSRSGWSYLTSGFRRLAVRDARRIDAITLT
jgi:Sigma-70 region 2